VTQVTLEHAAMAGRPSDLLARALRGDLTWVQQERWDCDALVRSADYHGITPLLWRALHDRPDRPVQLVERLAGAVNAEVARAAVRQRELGLVLKAFGSLAVDMVVLKGAALAYSCYEQPWLRMRTDTDVLIERTSLARARAALVATGYSPAPTVSTGEFVSHQMAFERRDEHGLTHAVDVHWKAVNPQLLADAVGFQDIWAASRIIPAAAGTSMRIPDAVWSLALACVHRLAHHQDQERLVWLYDIDLLTRALTTSEWNRFLTVSKERHISAICADGLEAAARYLGTSVPIDAIQSLKDAGQGEPSRTYTERAQRRLAVLRNDLRHLRRWRDRARLLREHAFPSASFMMARYASHHRAWLPAFYVHRLLTGAWKWMRV
jgi:hypothetical protein